MESTNPGGDVDDTGPPREHSTVIQSDGGIEDHSDTDSSSLSLSRAATIAGTALLLMAALTGVGIPTLEGLFVPSDPAATAANLVVDDLQFRLAVGALAAVVLLDIVVAGALYVFLRPVDRDLSALAAIVRLVYSAAFAAAIANLAEIVRLLDGGPPTTAAQPGLQIQLLERYEAFQAGWDLALLFFGVHLLLVGYLAARAGYIPTALGVLIALAGAGYLYDSVAALVVSGYGLEIAMFAFVGEVALLAWLLYRGRRLQRSVVPGGDL